MMENPNRSKKMVIQSAKLDPNAASYTDDEIVGKVNAAAVSITRVDAIDGAALGDVDLDDIDDSATRLAMSDTELTKLIGIEEGATVDQTDEEIRDLILALPDTERGLVITDPTTGQFKVVSIERDPDGKFNLKYDDVAEP